MQKITNSRQFSKLTFTFVEREDHETQCLAPVLLDKQGQCICPNLYCARARRSSYRRGNFVSTSAELHDHGDERWPTEMTSNAYFRGQLGKVMAKRTRTIWDSKVFFSRRSNTDGVLTQELSEHWPVLLPGRVGGMPLSANRGVRGHYQSSVREQWEELREQVCHGRRGVHSGQAHWRAALRSLRWVVLMSSLVRDVITGLWCHCRMTSHLLVVIVRRHFPIFR